MKWTRGFRRVHQSEFRVLNVAHLQLLSERAKQAKFSAVGRTNWVRRQEPNIESVLIHVFGTEGPGVYRCIATLIMVRKEVRYFTLDVSHADFIDLPVLTRSHLADIGGELLRAARHVPVGC